MINEELKDINSLKKDKPQHLISNLNQSTYHENLQDILNKEMLLMQSSILSSINSKFLATSRLFPEQFNQTSDEKIDSSNILNFNCSLCLQQKEKERFVYYCTHPYCDSLKSICKNCEEKHCKNLSEPHILIKSYNLLIQDEKIYESQLLQSKYNISDYDYQCLNNNLSNTFTINKGKNFPITIHLKNTGKKHWKSNFEIVCLEKSKVRGDSVRIKSKIEVKKEITIEIKLQAEFLEKNEYSTFWIMKDDNGKTFGKEIEFCIVVV